LRIFSIFFHPSRKTTFLGGAERRFFDFLKFLDETGIKVTVVCPEYTVNLSGKNIKKIVVKRLFHIKSSSLMLNYLEWILWSIKAVIFSLSPVLKGEFDTIFSPNNTLPNIFPAFFLKFSCRKPLCVTVHHFDMTILEGTSEKHFTPSMINFFKIYRKVGYSFLISFVKALASKLMFEMLRKADLLISVSRFTASILKRNRVAGEKIFVSGNGIDFEKIFSFCKYPGEKLFDGVFVGRISFEKGIYDLVDAWRKIVLKRKNACLAIIGEGPELKNLKAKIQDLKLERNIFVYGGLPDEKMYKIVCKSKVFVFPSRFEGWGLAVAEALACGLPGICYEIPALKEVFGACKSVFFVSKFNSEVLAEKILEILENFDAEKFRKISLNFVKKFDKRRIFENDLNFILSGLKNLGLK